MTTLQDPRICFLSLGLAAVLTLYSNSLRFLSAYYNLCYIRDREIVTCSRLHLIDSFKTPYKLAETAGLRRLPYDNLR